MLLALACTPRPPTRHPRRIRWNASVLNENTPHYDLELLGSEGSHGRGENLPASPSDSAPLRGRGQGSGRLLQSSPRRSAIVSCRPTPPSRGQTTIRTR